MRIWVDADATPRDLKEMLYRAASRTKIEVVFVANSWLNLPRSNYLRLEVVGKGFDVADEYIEGKVEKGDLVITQDVPLAASVVDKGCIVIDVRGNLIDKRNAQSRLAMRDFREEQRLAGDVTGGPAPFSKKDGRRFAGELDRWLSRATRKR